MWRRQNYKGWLGINKCICCLWTTIFGSWLIASSFQRLLISRFGMPHLVQNNTHLRVMRLLCTLCALTIKRTFRYGYHLDVFFFLLIRTSWCLLNTTKGLAVCTFVLVLMTSVLLQFIFSTALDGKIKAWLYDNLGSRVDYDAPGRWCTTMAYSADGTRLILLMHCIIATLHSLLKSLGDNSFFSDLTFSLFLSASSFSLFPFGWGWVGGKIADYFHVEPAKMGSHTLLSGTKVKGLLREHI